MQKQIVYDEWLMKSRKAAKKHQPDFLAAGVQEHFGKAKNASGASFWRQESVWYLQQHRLKKKKASEIYTVSGT